MAIYRTARPEDWDEVIDVENYAFSHDHNPTDFPSILPRAYSEGADAKAVMAYHYVAEENGKIRGSIICPVASMVYAGHSFKVGLLGGVSVHPYFRCRGLMRGMMQNILDETEADLLVLCGQHQRYQYYGFEHAGCSLQFRFSPASVRHAWKDLDVSAFRIRPMMRTDPLLDEAFALYEKETITGLRTRENFYDVSISRNYHLMAILNAGAFAGYFTASDAGDITELAMVEEAYRDAALKLWSETIQKDFTVWTPPYHVSRIRDWMHTAEDFTAENQKQIRVLRWLPVLRAAMALRCAEGNMRDGEAVLTLDGSTYRLCVKDGVSSVEETDAPPDIPAMEGLEAIRCIFGMGNAVCPGIQFLPNNWLPLPFNIPFSDIF